jgi:hypothetical protein
MKCGIKQKICHQSNITEVNARDLNYMGISWCVGVLTY